MKKFVFILASMLLGLTSATATAQGEGLNNTRYRYAQPIMFVERGVEFMIFLTEVSTSIPILKTLTKQVICTTDQQLLVEAR